LYKSNYPSTSKNSDIAVPHNRVWGNHEAKLVEMQEEIDEAAITGGYFNISFYQKWIAPADRKLGLNTPPPSTNCI
jgi:hypothetical protein